MIHKRWLCHACLREWAHARREVPRSDESQCPICLSTDIEQVQYEPPFLGGDIPRGGEMAPLAPAPSAGPPAFVQPNLTIAATDDDVYGVPV